MLSTIISVLFIIVGPICFAAGSALPLVEGGSP